MKIHSSESTEGEREEPEDDAAQTPAQHLRDHLLTLSGLGTIPPVRPLIDGLLYRGTLAQMAGAPGSYKSFIAVAMACSVAAGIPFEGHAVPDGAGPVLYCAPEGASGLHVRIMAWCELNKVDPADLEGKLYTLPLPVRLKSTLEVGQAIEVATEIGAQLVVLDTRARCVVGLEENSATEQGIAIDRLEGLVRATGSTVLAVHHTGRIGAAGRGSTAWDGQVWTDLRITGDELRCTLSCHKHKDVPDGCKHEFRLVLHTVSAAAMPGCTDKQRETLVAVQAMHSLSGAVFGQNGRAVADIVRTLAGPDGLSKTEIVAFAADRDHGRSNTYAAINTLVRTGELRNVGTDSRPRYVATGPDPTQPEDHLEQNVRSVRSQSEGESSELARLSEQSGGSRRDPRTDGRTPDGKEPLTTASEASALELLWTELGATVLDES